MPADLGPGPYTLPELTDYFRKGLDALEQMAAGPPGGEVLAEETLVEETPGGDMLEESAAIEEPMPGDDDIAALLDAELGAGPPGPGLPGEEEEEDFDLEALTAKAAKNALA